MGAMMATDLERLWDQVADDMGWHDANMRRNRPYSGQPHTDTGARGATEIRGVTFRDLRDCFIRAYCLAAMPFYEEANKGELAALCENDLYGLKCEPGSSVVDPIAVSQNLACEIERLMGIYPNVPPLEVVE
jgi:hypothetical protein